MRESGNRVLRRLGLGLLLVVVIAAGWYLGSRVGDAGPNENTAALPEMDGEVYCDIAGRVVRLAPQEGVFTVDHEAVEGFMSAMVMDLQVAEPAELHGLEPGDAIRFDLARIGSTFMAVRIRRASADESTQRPTPPTQPADALGRGDLVPDLWLLNAEGERFRLHDMQPRHKVITFFYARCPLETFCPAQSRRLAELQAYLNESASDVHLLSLTLDAAHDDPEVLKGYARQFTVDPTRWTLAGSDDPVAIREFARRAGAHVQEHQDSFEIDHALVALRVDGNRIVDRVYGLDAIEKLLRDLSPSN